MLCVGLPSWALESMEGKNSGEGGRASLKSWHHPRGGGAHSHGTRRCLLASLSSHLGTQAVRNLMNFDAISPMPALGWWPLRALGDGSGVCCAHCLPLLPPRGPGSTGLCSWQTRTPNSLGWLLRQPNSWGWLEKERGAFAICLLSAPSAVRALPLPSGLRAEDRSAHA